MNKLLLNLDLYSESNVESAIDAYKSIARITYTIDGKYIVCEFFDCVYPVVTVMAEFENYLVAIVHRELHV